MKRILLTTLGLWVFLSPMLCLAGVASHVCGDCDVSVCSHEEECADDPCPDLFVTSWSYRDDSVTFFTSEVVPNRNFDPDVCPDESLTAGLPPDGFSPNLQVFVSDLPLLN